MKEGSFMIAGSPSHPERLVQLNPHGHWRRIPEHEECGYTQIMSCSCCSLTKDSPEKIRSDESTEPEEASTESKAQEPRSSAPASPRLAAPRCQESHAFPTKAEKPATTSSNIPDDGDVDGQEEMDWALDVPDEGQETSCAWLSCAWTASGKQEGVDGMAGPPAAMTLQAAPPAPAPTPVACQQRAQQDIASGQEPKEPAPQNPREAEQPQEVRVTKIKRPHPTTVTYQYRPYVTRQKAEAKGFKIVWYDPENTYNPLYFGVSPEDIEEQNALDERRDCQKYLDPALALQYAGIALGAVVGAGVFGVGFVTVAAGVAVGCTVSELSPYYSRVQNTMERLIFSRGWD
ncbi:hypothetical protein TGME49_294340 [Toxoplasma gondii ME49]|uniref:Uncharacterized protein n=2 Tax=Toxoplasma gondii TaxID=5811 RepID=S8FFI1_TOXGM|nr:hypothetical protein TGME49_294340 [Toxoplasma gondii ME49]EPT32598.1 hypothetical protein TGME49_294340 [Toxoplasma gondii ME49]ESS29310.1 putative transmembrane protein [Toxoplasma gondii VEG]CEL71494.1 TPA: hypothetical protein BN1205_013530 [Toxoplasma gondii VEG]|eukprot:XP_018638593.1 hypothetical protein TGME49_294340 [Toxoplasma gondii ME49]